MSWAPVPLFLTLLLVGCATPLHLRPVALTGDGRELPALFLGGWDGHRLGVFDDSNVEPGVTRAEDLARALSYLSKEQYGVVYLESANLHPEVASAHGLFCAAPVCLVVLERNGGATFNTWGTTLAVFELNGSHRDVVGSVWMDGRAVRLPGPKSWPLLCRNKTDQPHNVHPDGGAIFPAKSGNGPDGFALFGPIDLPAEFHRSGFAAPSATLCDQEAVDQSKEPQPERPVVAPDPALMQTPAATPAAPQPEPKRRRRK